ncbi:MAG: KH domain-containing protein [Krumholzibacteria bacterium]|nr:KH domain-containing protein [Candidatus Krumholzibacteria bacterium]
MLELVSYVVVNLVEHPDDVVVDIVRREGRDVYRVKVHAEDLGKVIGKGGQTARALRVLLAAVSARTDQRLGLEIVE